jgi:hypothetical protein
MDTVSNKILFVFRDHLDIAYNLEIQEEAKTAIEECKAYLKKFDSKVK